MGNPFLPMKQRRKLKSLVSGGKTIGIGSPRASLEANFALAHAGREGSVFCRRCGRPVADDYSDGQDSPDGAGPFAIPA